MLKVFGCRAGMIQMSCSLNEVWPRQFFWLAGASMLVPSCGFVILWRSSYHLCLQIRREKRKCRPTFYNQKLERKEKSQRMWKYFLKCTFGTKKVDVNFSHIPLFENKSEIQTKMCTCTYLHRNCILWQWKHDFGRQLSISTRPVKHIHESLTSSFTCII